LETRYVVHYGGDVFNFDNSATNFVVQITKNSIVFDPTFGSVEENNDYCAKDSAEVVSRKIDFCSCESSGMYYSCAYGKCVAESQLDSSVKESNNAKGMF